MTRIARTLLVQIAVLAFASCVETDRPGDDSAVAHPAAPDSAVPHHAAASPHSSAGGVGEPADMSVYHLEGEWTDARDSTRTLGDALAGRVQVLALVYTSCALACPAVIADMKRIEAATGDAGFVLVSIDPARDTPERLRVFAEGSRLSPERWTLLTGNDDDLLELSAVLGVRYRRISNTDFMHSNMLTVLDAEGRIVHRQLGLGQVDETIAATRSP